MRTDATAFVSKNNAIQKRPRYVIELSFDSANTIIWYFTSHSDAAVPGGASVIHNVIEGLSGTSQTLSPDRALSTIGAISFKLVDRGSVVTNELGTQLALGRSTRRQRVRFYVGYEDLAWTDYSLITTQLVNDIAYQDGAYDIRCMDLQREMRKDIFELGKTTLAASVDAGSSTIQVYDTSSFTAVPHGNSYSDSPNTSVYYFKIDDEVIKATGKTSTSFTGCTRGALNTRPVDHTVDPASSPERRTAVTEYVYLEMPALKLIYALLTGVLYNQGGATLPTRWHLGIPTSYVKLSDFIDKPDLWNTANDQEGFVVRLEDLDMTDGKRFIEQELLLLIGSFMPVYADGSLGFKRMSNILAGASYVRQLDETNVVSASQLKHDFDSLHNNLQVSWNYEPVQEDFTRINVLIDSDSITVHGKSDPLQLEFRGLHGSRHSSTMLAQRFDALRDRYSGPPLRMSVTVLPSLNPIEIGDVVRVNLKTVRDFVANGPLDRSFEVQKVQCDWVTGALTFDLFASSQAAGALAPSTDSNILTQAWYTGTGTNLASVLSISGSNPGHVVASATLGGGIYYYNGDLQIDPGVTINITDTTQFRIKGFFQNNGTINGRGRGLPGAGTVGSPGYASVPDQYSHNAGTPGFIGSTEAGGGVFVHKIPFGFGAYFQELFANRGQSISAPNSVMPSFNLNWDGTTLSGLPSDLRGSSGSSGMPLKWEQPTFGIAFADEPGGNGGAGGAGLVIVCRGFSQGAAGKIDLSGADGSTGGAYQSPTGLSLPHPVVYYAGSGAGGAPGGLLVVLDGAGASATGLGAGGFIAMNGRTPIPPAQQMRQPDDILDFNYYGSVRSIYDGTGDGTTFALPDLSGARGGSRVQFVPNNTASTVQVDASKIKLQPPSQLQGTLSGGTLTAIWNPSPDPLVAGYDLEYKLTSSSTWPASPNVSVSGRTTASATLGTGLGVGPYEIRIRSAGSHREVGDWVNQQRLVETIDLNDAAVTTPKVGDLSITTPKLGDLAVTTPKVGDAAVTTPKINDGAVTTPKVDDAAVTTPKIADDAVIAQKIADAQLDLVKLTDALLAVLSYGDARNKVRNPGFESGTNYWLDSTGTVFSVINSAANAHTGNRYGRITTTAANNTDVFQSDGTDVAWSEVNPGDVIKYGGWIKKITQASGGEGRVVLQMVDKDFANPQVFSVGSSSTSWTEVSGEATVPAGKKYINVYIELNNNGVSQTGVYDFDDIICLRETPGTDIVAHSIIADRIAAGTITANEIASLTITAAQIAAATITAAKIAAGTITANEIASGTITAGNMLAGTITAASGIIADAAITTAKIADLNVTTLKIANQAVTIPTSVFTNASISITTSDTDVQTLTATFTGAPVFFHFAADIQNAAGVDDKFNWQIIKDGSVFLSGISIYVKTNNGTVFSFSFQDTPTAASHTYKLRMWCGVGQMNGQQRSGLALECKK